MALNAEELERVRVKALEQAKAEKKTRNSEHVGNLVGVK